MVDGARPAAPAYEPNRILVSDLHWERIKNLLHEAMQLTPEQRSRFLDEACPSNDPCRAEVDALLRLFGAGGGS